MVGVVVITHGEFGAELVRTAFGIAGAQEGVEAVGFFPSEKREDLLQHTIEAINKVDKGDGTLLLTDLFGASCSTVPSALLEEKRVEIITGVNLPMLLEVLLYRPTNPLERLRVLALDSGRRGILDVREKVT